MLNLGGTFRGVPLLYSESMEPQRLVSAALDIDLRVGQAHVKLAELRELTDRLQRALAAVAKHLAGGAESGIDFEVVSAKVGSLHFGLQAVSAGMPSVDPDLVLATFATDLAEIKRQSYRADLTAGLTKHYRSLVTCLGGEGATVEYNHRDQRVVVDDAFRSSFEAALKERVAQGVSVVGYLDAVNAHRAPFAFYLYPKLEDAERIECRFPPEMLETVAALLKKTVRVAGTGHFAPVGIYPLRVEVEQLPRLLPWDPGVLRSLVGKLALVPAGVNVSDYLQRNREVAGFAD